VVLAVVALGACGGYVDPREAGDASGAMAGGYYSVDPSNADMPLGREPDPDATRRVNEQDCTQPVDPSAGNLKCKSR
jgi:hypothetical protein